MKNIIKNVYIYIYIIKYNRYCLFQLFVMLFAREYEYDLSILKFAQNTCSCLWLEDNILCIYLNGSLY